MSKVLKVLWTAQLTVCLFMSRTPLSLTGLKYWEWSLTVNLTSVCRGNWSLVWTLNTSTCSTVVFRSLARASLSVTSRLEVEELEFWNIYTISRLKQLQLSVHLQSVFIGNDDFLFVYDHLKMADSFKNIIVSKGLATNKIKHNDL